MPVQPRPVMERLMENVVVNERGCWVFTGAKDPAGYGRIGLGGRGTGTGLTHRVTYEHHHGAVPEGLDLDHLCRNRACCNPEHLEPVTRLVNVNRGLRGKGYGGTHCKRGHEYTPENTGHTKTQRYCRTCHRMADRAAYYRKKNQAAPVAA